MLVSVNRIATKALLDQDNTPDALAFSTAVYFGVSVSVLAACAATFEAMRRLPFSAVHQASAAQGVELPGTLRPTVPPDLASVSDLSSPIKLRPLRPAPPPPSGAAVGRARLEEAAPDEQPSSDDLARPKAQLLQVARKVSLAAALAFANFFVTLAVYPGACAGRRARREETAG